MNFSMNCVRSLALLLALAALSLTACSGDTDTVGNGSSSSGASSSGQSSSGASSSGASSSGASSSSSSGGSTSSGGQVGDGPPCEKLDDCKALDCGCSDGSSTSYRACTNGRCETKCPSNTHAAGESCVTPGGCFCASGSCEFSTSVCCASKGSLGSQAACSSDCECASGSCSFGKCFGL